MRRTRAIFLAVTFLAVPIGPALGDEGERTDAEGDRATFFYDEDTRGRHNEGGFILPDTLALEDSLVLDDALWEESAATEGCARDSRLRLYDNPDDSGNEVVTVYLVPSGATDRKLDVPKSCTNGDIKRSPLQGMWRQQKIWLARETNVGSYPSSQYRRMYNPADFDHRNPHTGTIETMTEVVFMSDSRSVSTWNCWSPNTKLSKIEDKLIGAGFNSTNLNYMVILEAAQPDSCTSNDNKGKVGNGTVPGQYNYAIVNAGSSGQFRLAFGCANKIGATVAYHELTHNMGAQHTAGPRDLMYEGDPRPFATDSGGQDQYFDHGTDQYRGTALTDSSFDQSGEGFVSGVNYRLC